jgi:hypothetical protein
MTLINGARVLDPGVAQYVAREAVISAIINAAISVAFFIAVFGFGARVSVWGVGNYAFDFLPQSLAVTFFASFVPSLLTRKAIAAGKVAGVGGTSASVTDLLKRSILLGLGMMFLGAGVWACLLWLSGIETISFLPAFSLKILYGGILGALVTRYRLTAMLG